MHAEGEFCMGDPVVVRLPLLGTETERKTARGVVTSVDGERITVRLIEGDADADAPAPTITIAADDVVPAPIAEVP